MSVNIQITNNMLNLATLQNKMDETVFNYVDTTVNWQKAYAILDDLLHQTVNYFNQYIEQRNGELPTSNSYWTLFMNIASRLIYFNGMTHAKLIDIQDEGAKNNIENLYKISVTCMPNSRLEQNEQLLEEIVASYLELEPNGERAHILDKVGSSGEDCIQSFYELCKTYN